MLSHKTRWTVEKIAARLELIAPLVYRRQMPLPDFRYLPLHGPLEQPPVGVEIDTSNWKIIAPHSYWGGWMQDFVLRLYFIAPQDWLADGPVVLHLPLGEGGSFEHPEALAYIDGLPYATIDRHHHEIRLPESLCDSQPHLLALHGWTGIHDDIWTAPGKQFYLQPCSIAQVDQPTRDFLATARVCLGIARDLPDNDPTRSALLNALDAGFYALDTREPLPDGFYDSIPAAMEDLQAGIVQAGPSLDVEVILAGHAHIDVAWLWTLGQTRRKAGRTFYNVIRLMEQFPEYHFSQSQPQLYDFVRQDYPELFSLIQQRAAEGRWELLGGTWVEADCNLSGAESLARQFLLGRSFFQEHFGAGADSPVLWLPDVFGYAWNLPQLIKQAGLEYFFTIKIGWNQYNRMPYDSFWWQGLDGTRVLTHYSTTPEENSAFASTYNAEVTPRQALRTWSNFQQKELQHTLLMAYGYGDGGGGPTQEMLENARQMADFPATPRLTPGRVGDFFERLESESGALLPVWDGELYLEYHRGTYTTQARNKRLNRRSEFLLHDAEFLASLASLHVPGFDYPHHKFKAAWQLVCLNQFHDIIPGSSIAPVYAESAQQYAEVHRLADEARQQSLKALAGWMGTDWLLVNPSSFTRSELAFYPGNLTDLPSNLRVQATEGGAWLDVGEMPAYSVLPLEICQPQPASGSLVAAPDRLENDYLRIELDEAGDIRRIYDKIARREVLLPGAIANQWQAFEDRPLNFDAWDIDIFYEDRMWLAEPAESVQISEAGPLRATLEIRRRILNSSYTQRISLAHNSPRLDFHTHIDWRERHILLKTAFPVEVLSPQATFEIQWGNVQRPTHRNTSWDWARFETCAHKWIDLSEGGYGVSLLNDCKYGHDVHANVMRLTLLRSPTMPDPQADLGEHEFSYSLLPHSGGWGRDTVRQAYALNDPLIVYHAPAAKTETPQISAPLVSIEAEQAVIETVKQAEDGNGLIVRLYECQRHRETVTLKCGFPLASAQRSNLLEMDGENLPINGQQISFLLKPYEIVTLRLVPA